MSTMLNLNRDPEGAGVQSDEEGYPSWTNAELSAELEARGLPKSGNKEELIARLEEDDAA